MAPKGTPLPAPAKAKGKKTPSAPILDPVPAPTYVTAPVPTPIPEDSSFDVPLTEVVRLAQERKRKQFKGTLSQTEKTQSAPQPPRKKKKKSKQQSGYGATRPKRVAEGRNSVREDDESRVNNVSDFVKTPTLQQKPMQVEEVTSANASDIIAKIARETSKNVEDLATVEDLVRSRSPINVDVELAQQLANEDQTKANISIGEASELSTNEDLLAELLRVTTWKK
ncbi:PREDICTED: uncharacterized protein LOC109150203 [Ipomoea nil]|uniref:uncharacterized protein LOC109150203 n=1 Tax=Ipomoea nil TaxID=35883 RepID=UPI0009014DE7|nr:PREDICTED: uncharacterized protein LOC109150203 [Ipomoea nil]